jgi:hypothetical protein
MIKTWHLKAVLQTLVATLPASTRINYQLQYLTGGNALSDQTFEYKVTHALAHLENFLEKRDRPRGVALELGTGWFPVVPLYLYLVGFDKIWSVDVNNWLRPKNVVRTAAKYLDWERKGKLTRHVSHVVPERRDILSRIVEQGNSLALDDLCALFAFSPLQADARRLTSFADNSIDLVCSNNTFEHIPPEILKDILIEFSRVVKKTHGVLSHHIDLSDHHSHFDGSITRYNFLYVTKSFWSVVNNDLNYQNRLRFVDYKRIYDQVGIPYREAQVIPGTPEIIDRKRLVEPFGTYSSDELAVLGGYLVS